MVPQRLTEHFGIRLEVLSLWDNPLSGPIAALETRLVRWMVALAGIVVAAQRFL